MSTEDDAITYFFKNFWAAKSRGPSAYITSRTSDLGSFKAELVFANREFQPAESDTPLYTLEQAKNVLKEAEDKLFMETIANQKKLTEEWSETNRQIAIIMATTGTPQQQEEARAFFNRHPHAAADWFRCVMMQKPYNG